MSAAFGSDDITIEPLASEHERGAFVCGRVRLDNFLKNNAKNDHKLYKVRVFVACPVEKREVLGFYSLCVRTYIPEQMGKKALDKFARVNTVPSIYLAMIGVSKQYQGRKLGNLLMQNAFERALLIAEHAGTYALTLNAATDQLLGFYEKLGFEPFGPENERAMFLPLAVLRAASA